MKLSIKKLWYSVYLTWLLVALQGKANATIIDVSIQTSAIQGVTAEIAFDLVAGDGNTYNSATISSFLTDGSVLSSAQLTGDATGSLSSNAELANSQFFNELLQPITLGNSISFSLNITESLDQNATIPDSVSVFLLDDNQNNLFPTTDPTGANSLFQFDITGISAGNLVVYQASTSTNPVTWTATDEDLMSLPLPSSASLLLIGLGCVSLRKLKKSLKPSINA